MDAINIQNTINALLILRRDIQENIQFKIEYSDNAAIELITLEKSIMILLEYAAGSRKKVFFVYESVKDAHGNYLACICRPGIKGYKITDITMGKDLFIAGKIATKKNIESGIDCLEAENIIKAAQ